MSEGNEHNNYGCERVGREMLNRNIKILQRFYCARADASVYMSASGPLSGTWRVTELRYEDLLGTQ